MLPQIAILLCRDIFICGYYYIYLWATPTRLVVLFGYINSLLGVVQVPHARDTEIVLLWGTLLYKVVPYRGTSIKLCWV